MSNLAGTPKTSAAILDGYFAALSSKLSLFHCRHLSNPPPSPLTRALPQQTQATIKLLLLIMAVLATTASAIKVNAEITGTVYGAQCAEELHEGFFSKCIDDIAGSLGFRNRNLREAQRELKCTQSH